MDDYGNDILLEYLPTEQNWNPQTFNWSAYVYYMVPEYYKFDIRPNAGN